MSIHMRFEEMMLDLHGRPYPFMPQESNAFLGSTASLRKLVAADGADCTDNRHSLSTDNNPRSIPVSGLELGREQTSLKLLELAAPLVQVKTWKTLEFNGLGRAESRFPLCGPFEFITRGEDKRFKVTVAARSRFSQKQEESRKRIPLDFLHHQYVANKAVIVDSSGHRLISIATSGTRESRTSTLVIIDLPNAKPVESSRGEIGAGVVQWAVEYKDIAYPVTVTMRIPEKWTAETATFRFTDVPLPSMAEGRWEIGQRWELPSSKSAADSKKPGASVKPYP